MCKLFIYNFANLSTQKLKPVVSVLRGLDMLIVLVRIKDKVIYEFSFDMIVSFCSETSDCVHIWSFIVSKLATHMCPCANVEMSIK